MRKEGEEKCSSPARIGIFFFVNYVNKLLFLTLYLDLVRKQLIFRHREDKHEKRTF